MRIVVALTALFALLLGMPGSAGAVAVPAAADAAPESTTSARSTSTQPPATKAAGSSAAVVRLRDRRGDVRSSKGDLVAASLVYGEPNMTLRAVTDTMGSVRSRAWQHGFTTMFWYLDTDRVYGDDYEVWLFNDGHDRIRAQVRRSSGNKAVVCRGRFRAKTSYQVRFDRSCIGTPKRVRFHIAFGYDVDIDSPRSGSRVDQAPGGGGYSDWAKRPRFKTQFLNTYPRSVSRDQETSVSADLVQTSTRSSLWDRPVKVYARPKGAREFSLVGRTRTSDYDGSVYWRVTATRSTDYRFRFPGTRKLLPAVSPVIPVNVVRFVTLGPDRSDFAVGQTATLSGTVTPAQSGLGVILQRQTKSGWVDEATTTTRTPEEGETAPYEFSFSPSESGAFVYRVVAAGDQIYARSPATAVLMSVVAVEITAVEAGNGPSDALDPNAEFIVLHNTGTVTAYLASWLVEANLVEVATIPQGALDPGESVQVHTGSGTHTAQQLYLGRGRPMWPESGGIARLYHLNGQVVDELQYGPG